MTAMQAMRHTWAYYSENKYHWRTKMTAEAKFAVGEVCHVRDSHGALHENVTVLEAFFETFHTIATGLPHPAGWCYHLDCHPSWQHISPEEDLIKKEDGEDFDRFMDKALGKDGPIEITPEQPILEEVQG